MRRSVTVIRVLPDGKAEVAMERPTACGGNCSSCGGCSATAKAVVSNPIHAKAGEAVIIEGSDRRLLKLTALVYLLPVLLMLAGLLLGEQVWRQGPMALLGFVLGVVIVVILGRVEKTRPPVYRIVERR